MVVVAVSIPFGARTGAHIEIELLDGRLPRRVGRVTLAGVKALGIGLTGVLAWRLWLAGGEASRFGEASQQLVISFGPFYRILAVAIGLYALVLLLELVEIVRGRTVPRIDLESVDPERVGAAP